MADRKSRKEERKRAAMKERGIRAEIVWRKENKKNAARNTEEARGKRAKRKNANRQKQRNAETGLRKNMMTSDDGAMDEMTGKRGAIQTDRSPLLRRFSPPDTRRLGKWENWEGGSKKNVRKREQPPNRKMTGK